VTTLDPNAFFKNTLTKFSVASDNTAYIAKGLFLLSKDGKKLITYYGSAKNVTIPNGVTVIGNGAFLENQLISIVIPNSVTKIEDYAFADNQLTSVVIPDSVTEIGSHAFIDNQLTSVVIPNTVTKIGARAFSDNKLTSITIGANVEICKTYVVNNAFNNSFEKVYNSTDKAAGTYILRDGVWSRR
jgi:hypothetical protein